MKKLLMLLDGLIPLSALRAFDRYAVILAAALLFFLLFKAFVFHSVDRELNKIFNEKPKKTAVEKVDSRPVNQKPYSFYSEQIADKSLFTVSSRPSASFSQNTGGSPLKNITLVGILPGVNLQAALEDKASQKTYYLSKNQTLNDITVIDIRDNAVVLEYNGETETLTL